MPRIHPALLALLLLLLTLTPAATRAQAAPEAGRVSVTVRSGGRIRAALSRADSAAAQRLAISERSAASAPMAGEAWRRAAERRRHTLEGAVVGGTFGALIGYLAIRPDGTTEPNSCARGCGGVSGGGFLIGAGVGALVGGIVGYQIRTGP